MTPDAPGPHGSHAPRSPLVPGALNLRDVGGLRAGPGTTRPGVLFRSGNLAGLGEQGRSALAALGIRRVIDLRADDEVAYEPSRTAGLGLETTRVPLFLGSVASFFVADRSLGEMYRELVDESGARLADVARAAAAALTAREPVLVHCTVGKDRTGVAVAILLAAVGVDEDAIVADYARTEGMLPPERNARVLAYLRSMHPHARHLEDLATRSPASAMQHLLEDVRERHGSAADYLRAHGVAEAELSHVRAALIEH